MEDDDAFLAPQPGRSRAAAGASTSSVVDLTDESIDGDLAPQHASSRAAASTSSTEQNLSKMKERLSLAVFAAIEVCAPQPHCDVCPIATCVPLRRVSYCDVCPTATCVPLSLAQYNRDHERCVCVWTLDSVAPDSPLFLRRAYRAFCSPYSAPLPPHTSFWSFGRPGGRVFSPSITLLPSPLPPPPPPGG